MKSLIALTLAFGIVLSVSAAPAAKPPSLGGMGGMAPGAPQFSATFSKLFGEHKAFSATMNTEVTQFESKETFTTPCKVAFLDGKSRMEVDVAQSKGSNIPAGMTEHLKAMGMSEMVIISVPSKHTAYFIYPGLQSYAEIPSTENKADDSKTKVEEKSLGEETIDGQRCLKTKMIISGQDGPEEALVWNAVELKKFPIRIETADATAKAVMNFRDVKFEKPDAKLFEPPANFTRYNNIQTMMQEGIMKKMQGGGLPPNK